MKRTQIYLTEQEKKALRAIAERMGTSQSKIIRSAVDRYIKLHHAGSRLELLKKGRGLWAKRDDLPDFGTVRKEFDRA